jgi:transcriptional regulator with XRE-family HTH domain
MGSASRRELHSPKRLASKLLRIRQELGLSQNEMIKALGSPERVLQSSISGYELGVRLPPYLILLRYARVAGVSTDVLIDDKLDLPDKLGIQKKERVNEGKRR